MGADRTAFFGQSSFVQEYVTIVIGFLDFGNTLQVYALTAACPSARDCRADRGRMLLAVSELAQQRLHVSHDPLAISRH
jgi:hypothetical protein